jgi:hypothetical protein
VGTETLITAIVRQVTVLIAQLATAGGVRAPLAQLADQVFVDLARELEAQGVGRKVSADMFGMALRAYQRKVRRLSAGDGGTTRSLWGEVLERLEGLEGGETRSRSELLADFRADDEATVRAVLRDLASSGLVVADTRREEPRYRLASQQELARVRDDSGLDALITLLAYREGPLTLDALAAGVGVASGELEPRLHALVEAGHLTHGDDGYHTADFSVPLGQAQGWEAAVLDHVQALVRTIGQRLGVGGQVPDGAELVGGSTYSLDVWDGHPLAVEVDESLQRFRREHSALRARVDAYNAEHGLPARYRQVVVYGGQCMIERELEGDVEDGER